MKLRGYSMLTDDVIDIGPEDPDQILELGSFAAEGHDNLIVFLDEPSRLQQWVD